MEINLDDLYKDAVYIEDVSGNYITGLTSGDFSITLTDDDGVNKISQLSEFSELGSGDYYVGFTPDSEGTWYLKLSHPTYGIYKNSYRCNNNETIQDLILEDTDTLESDLKTYMDSKTDSISGYISNHNDQLLSTESNLSGLIDDSKQSISGTIDSSTTQISGYIVNSEDNIRGADNKDLTETNINIDTNESKIDIIDNNVDLILTDTETTIPSLITDETDTIDSSLSSLHNKTDLISGLVSGIKYDTDTNLPAAIAATESNIRGADSDDLATLSSQLDTIQNKLFVDVEVPSELILPETGSRAYKFLLGMYDGQGNPEVPDSTPTVTITNTDGDTILSETNMTQFPGEDGQYYYTYTIQSDDDQQRLTVDMKVIENGITTHYRQMTETTIFENDLNDAASQLAAIRAKTDYLPADTETSMNMILALLNHNSVLRIDEKTATGKGAHAYLEGYDGDPTDEDSSMIYRWEIEGTYDDSDSLNINTVKEVDVV